MQKTAMSLAIVACCALGTAAFAAGTTKDAAKAEKESIEATYKSELKTCDAMKANAKDICKAEAKGKERVAKAELEARDKPSPKADEKLRKAKADATYGVAKEKCEDLKAAEQTTCKKDAKAAHDSAAKST